MRQHFPAARPDQIDLGAKQSGPGPNQGQRQAACDFSWRSFRRAARSELAAPGSLAVGGNLPKSKSYPTFSVHSRDDPATRNANIAEDPTRVVPRSAVAEWSRRHSALRRNDDVLPLARRSVRAAISPPRRILQPAYVSWLHPRGF